MDESGWKMRRAMWKTPNINLNVGAAQRRAQGRHGGERVEDGGGRRVPPAAL